MNTPNAPVDSFDRQFGGCGGVAITPSDTTPVNPTVTYRGLYVGVTGDVAVVFVDNSVVTLKGMAAGMIHPICFNRINATNTTATNLVAIL